MEVTKKKFLGVNALETEPLIVRSPRTKFRSSEPTGVSRYLASVKDFGLPEECIVIEAENITVLKDL